MTPRSSALAASERKRHILARMPLGCSGDPHAT